MEYKFKTVYHGELIPCIPCYPDNRVLVYTTYPHFTQIGLIESEKGIYLDVLPIFPYTGKKDIHGEEIYIGHFVRKKTGLKKMKKNGIYKIFYNKFDNSICIDIDGQIGAFWSDHEYEIMGHSGIEEKEEKKI